MILLAASSCSITSLSMDNLNDACWLKCKTVVQALLTIRKGKKRFAMYDLTITLTWEGLWVEDDNKQVTFVHASHVCLCPFSLSPTLKVRL